MVKIEESEDFHPRKKMTSPLKMAAFLENFFFVRTLYIKVRRVLKISGSWLLWLKSYYNLNPIAGQKAPPSPRAWDRFYRTPPVVASGQN